ncbi:hypothetical protein PS865_03050 [Pseudomonas fluorescens]|uniref:DUF6124 family protein n=1 Tax=Pseudomonas fluorescens TaxID=294 RepID=UPI0012523556|nr:hypothetical protein [Pseudomonas fluorescens]VVP05115.1 hypothetical protein PS865_03050 [Pseudomonas fluorescens]
MFKVTPNPPETDPASPYESLDSKKLHEAAERALDHYLIPPKTCSPPYQASSMFMVNPGTDTESLLVNASESLGSASVMLGDFAALLDGSQRKTLLGINGIRGRHRKMLLLILFYQQSENFQLNAL